MSNTVNRMSNTVTSIYGASFKLSSGNSIQTISGLLDITSAFAAFGGPYGAAVGAAAGLVNSILGCFGAKGPSLPKIIGDLIQEQTQQIAGMLDEQTRQIADMFEAHGEMMKESFQQISSQISHNAYQNNRLFLILKCLFDEAINFKLKCTIPNLSEHT